MFAFRVLCEKAPQQAEITENTEFYISFSFVLSVQNVSKNAKYSCSFEMVKNEYTCLWAFPQTSFRVSKHNLQLLGNSKTLERKLIGFEKVFRKSNS